MYARISFELLWNVLAGVAGVGCSTTAPVHPPRPVEHNILAQSVMNYRIARASAAHVTHFSVRIIPGESGRGANLFRRPSTVRR